MYISENLIIFDSENLSKMKFLLSLTRGN